MKAVSIIIPTRNEAENIATLIDHIFLVVKKKFIKAEIIIVDDSSQDGTCEKVLELAEKYPLTLVCRETARGQASAVVAGAHRARHEVIVVMDGDFSHSPEDIPRLINPLV